MKIEIVNLLKESLLAKKNELSKNIEIVQNSANNESKSSMGDKYETGRAMAQNEVFMLQTQLANINTDIEKLKSINFDLTSPSTVPGSLVKTSMGTFLISVGFGKLGKTPVMCISTHSPLAQVLIGKTVNEEFVINTKKAKILEIL